MSKYSHILCFYLKQLNIFALFLFETITYALFLFKKMNLKLNIKLPRPMAMALSWVLLDH